MNETTEKNRFRAALACAAFTCTMILDGLALLHDINHELLWDYELNTVRTAILISACLVMALGKVFGGHYRKEILKRRAILSLAFGACSVFGHVAALVLQGVNNSNDAIVMAVNVVTPLLMIVPTSLAAGLAASFTWGSCRLSNALCFPCAMFLALFLGNSLGISDDCISLACSIAGFALLLFESESGGECFCAWTRPLTYDLAFVMENANIKIMQPKWGIAIMIVMSCIAVYTQTIEAGWPMAIMVLALMVFYYRGNIGANCVGVAVVLIACMLIVLGASNGKELCIMAMLASLGAMVCLECGPKGLLLSVGGMFAAVGLIEPIRDPICYLVLFDVSAITLLPLIPCALFVLICRPDRRIISTWNIACEETEDTE